MPDHCAHYSGVRDDPVVCNPMLDTLQLCRRVRVTIVPTNSTALGAAYMMTRTCTLRGDPAEIQVVSAATSRRRHRGATWWN